MTGVKNTNYEFVSDLRLLVQYFSNILGFRVITKRFHKTVFADFQQYAGIKGCQNVYYNFCLI